MGGQRIISIGYEGRSADEVVTELVQRRVTLLVDVRLTPLSRKPGLSKRGLAARLAEAGIEYLHMRALGNPKHNRASFRAGRIDEGRGIFEGLLDQPASEEALQAVTALADQHVVALLCFERDPEQCHRQVVTERVVERLRSRARVVHA